jgi:hypothetical protein
MELWKWNSFLKSQTLERRGQEFNLILHRVPYRHISIPFFIK